MTPREFAIDVVRRLRQAGYEALWAGGCVRDQLLGRRPKDYDVATSAKPKEIRDVFGRGRTLPIGAQFGVITVVGPKSAGQIEVATFREDAEYSDGRHPDAVVFSSAEADAQRRDFTINGLFYDPLEERVIDYVGGLEDLAQQRIRAIGSADERIAEDKLRMLRAVRFAATFDFQLDAATMSAVVRNSEQITVVSPERIVAELRRMWDHANLAIAMEKLIDSRLLKSILPAASLFDDKDHREQLLQRLRRISNPAFETVLAIALLPLDYPPEQIRDELAYEWRMTNEESRVITHQIQYRDPLLAADQIPWPQLQRILINRDVKWLLEFAAATADCADQTTAVEHARQKLQLPPELLNPKPLISGNELLDLGLEPGPKIKEILYAIRDAQLEQIVASPEEAIALARELM